MSKNVVAKRGRPARELGKDFFISVLKEIKGTPKTVKQINLEGVNNYYMQKILARGYAEASMEKVTDGRGRPSKVFKMTEKGRKYLSSTVAKMNKDV